MVRNIGLDFDDTLIPTRQALVDFFNLRFGTSFKAQDIAEFRFRSTWPLTDEVFAEIFSANIEHFHNLAPLPGVLEALHEWRKDSRFYIITGRPACWLAPAEAWLRRQGIPYETILNTQEMTDKGRLAVENKISLFIEDHTEAAVSIAELGIDVLLLDMPYNQKCSHPAHLPGAGLDGNSLAGFVPATNR